MLLYERLRSLVRFIMVYLFKNFGSYLVASYVIVYKSSRTYCTGCNKANTQGLSSILWYNQTRLACSLLLPFLSNVRTRISVETGALQK